MLVPELRYTLAERASIPYQVALVGIETHICVTQTALDLLSEGHRVYVLADGVSSCNGGERGVALNRLRYVRCCVWRFWEGRSEGGKVRVWLIDVLFVVCRAEGAIITSSESFLYEWYGYPISWHGRKEVADFEM